MSSRRFHIDWDDILDAQTETIRRRFPEDDEQRAEELNEDIELQEKDMMGSEAEHIAEKQAEELPEAVTREFTEAHMEQIASHSSAEEVNRINMSARDEIGSVNLKFEDERFTGVSDVDVGAVEKEDVTGLVRSIDEIIQNLDLVEDVTLETNPRDDVDFKRQGHTTEMMLRGSGGQFDWEEAERGLYPGEDMISGAPRYFAFNDTYDGVMQVAGTGSLQTTMRPKIYREHENNPDKWIRDFSGGGESIGMHALSPLIYGPFQASPVIEEISGEDEGFRKVIESLNGRDKAYGQGFQNEHDSKGLGKDESEYVTENSKAAYSPELADIQDLKEQVNFPADSEMTFSNQIQASKMKVVKEGEEYDPENDYDTLDEAVSFLEPGESGFIRVGHEDWNLDGGRNVITTDEFPEHERLEGTVYIVHEDGERESKRVVVDYRDEELFPDEEFDQDDFLRIAQGHYSADATAVWPSWRMRPDRPAFEYRDMCNNPFRNAGIATQVGAFRRWKEIQEFAEQTLGLTEEDAQELRLGVNGQLADHENDRNHMENTGLDYTVNEENEITLQDAWLGEGLETGLLDIISDGVDEMTTGEAYNANMYRDTMTELLENGLTPGEMMAKDYGVDIDGEILYRPDEMVLGDVDGF